MHVHGRFFFKEKKENNPETKHTKTQNMREMS